jgi:hypothetical protein
MEEHNNTEDFDQTIIFNGVEYNYKDLSAEAKYCIQQHQDLATQKQELTNKVHQVELALKGFSDLLGEALNRTEKTEETEETEE